MLLVAVAHSACGAGVAPSGKCAAGMDEGSLLQTVPGQASLIGNVVASGAPSCPVCPTCEDGKRCVRTYSGSRPDFECASSCYDEEAASDSYIFEGMSYFPTEALGGFCHILPGVRTCYSAATRGVTCIKDPNAPGGDTVGVCEIEPAPAPKLALTSTPTCQDRSFYCAGICQILGQFGGEGCEEKCRNHFSAAGGAMDELCSETESESETSFSFCEHMCLAYATSCNDQVECQTVCKAEFSSQCTLRSSRRRTSRRRTSQPPLAFACAQGVWDEFCEVGVCTPDE
eukprot:CAMPEP_0176138270 /NCGR_PEP_ID=MMETSP0120_2-20121206/70228_1 /TAXON_ID=160619 /ORGANISM="Kryptoperidinium foliaceum, Strain CCMP 1326" /LENGTH=285 /DNA_ID=CAMNT_0017474189 /DNA_START=59 /DNA_END=916 /DNA_ORIENTATION=-